MDTAPYKSDFVNVNGIRLHYLDWGGTGPVLLLLTGMGNSAHIYQTFAPRFRDTFHVLAVTRRGHGDSDYPETGYDVDTLTEDVWQFMNALSIDHAVFVGHSMANVELCHLAALYPERVRALVFLDSAYDRSSPAHHALTALEEKSPLRNIPIPSADDDHDSIEAYIAALKRWYPYWAAIWGEMLDADVRHGVKKNAAGTFVDKMSDTIRKAILDTLGSYTPEHAQIQAPVLSIYVFLDSNYFLTVAMTEEQQRLIREHFDTLAPPLIRECIEQFRRDVPHAKIIEITGHHHCFIGQEARVVAEMRTFFRATAL